MLCGWAGSSEVVAELVCCCEEECWPATAVSAEISGQCHTVSPSTHTIIFYYRLYYLVGLRYTAHLTPTQQGWGWLNMQFDILPSYLPFCLNNFEKSSQSKIHLAPGSHFAPPGPGTGTQLGTNGW